MIYRDCLDVSLSRPEEYSVRCIRCGYHVRVKDHLTALNSAEAHVLRAHPPQTAAIGE